MTGVDQQALRVAAGAYSAARGEYDAATMAADEAYERLQTSPETIEYQIEWNIARRDEAAAAWRLKETEERYVTAGGYPREIDE